MPIRPAIADDIPAILALEETSVTAAHYSGEQYGEIVKQGLMSAAAGVRSGGEEEKQSRLALVIEEDSLVKGFLIGRALGEEWEIENVVVAKEKQRRGRGTALVGEFLKIARVRGGRNVLLEVRESNTAARRLYEKCRFTETGRRKKYYREPEEDAVLYTWRVE